MNLDSADFWGPQGRIAFIRHGKHQGGYAFVYPDSLPNWWTIVVDPSPYTDAPLEVYFDGTDELAYFVQEWQLLWIPLEEDGPIEKSRFGRRPLSGTSWIDDGPHK